MVIVTFSLPVKSDVHPLLVQVCHNPVERVVPTLNQLGDAKLIRAKIVLRKVAIAKLSQIRFIIYEELFENTRRCKKIITTNKQITV